MATFCSQLLTNKLRKKTSLLPAYGNDVDLRPITPSVQNTITLPCCRCRFECAGPVKEALLLLGFPILSLPLVTIVNNNKFVFQVSTDHNQYFVHENAFS